MASKTITVDSNEWVYPDSNGIEHTVTNAQTFTFELTDTSATLVTYAIDDNQSVTTEDGFKVEFQPLVDGRSNRKLFIGPLADTMDGVATYNVGGELVCKCPTSGVVQYFRPEVVTIDDIDAPTSITATFKDQFGNTFSWTSVTIS